MIFGRRIPLLSKGDRRKNDSRNSSRAPAPRAARPSALCGIPSGCATGCIPHPGQAHRRTTPCCAPSDRAARSDRPTHTAALLFRSDLCSPSRFRQGPALRVRRDRAFRGFPETRVQSVCRAICQARGVLYRPVPPLRSGSARSQASGAYARTNIPAAMPDRLRRAAMPDPAYAQTVPAPFVTGTEAESGTDRRFGFRWASSRSGRSDRTCFQCCLPPALPDRRPAAPH